MGGREVVRLKAGEIEDKNEDHAEWMVRLGYAKTANTPKTAKKAKHPAKENKALKPAKENKTKTPKKQAKTKGIN